jgi:hypothetical protein
MPNRTVDVASTGPVSIGTKKQLFLDELLVESKKGVTLTFNPPFVPNENVVPQDKPWEECRVGGFSSVLEYKGAYHLWYTSYGGTGDEREEDMSPRLDCYAVSTDGIHWEKPNLGLIPFRGSKDTNIVRAYTFGQTFIDPFDDASRRFKVITFLPPKKYGWPALEKVKGGNIYLAYSPDAIHWDLEPEPVLPFSPGAPSSTVWDESLQKWVVYLRVYPHGHKTDPWGSHMAFGRIEVDKHKLAEPYPFTPDPSKKRNEYGCYGAANYEFPIAFQTDDRDPDHMVYKMNAVKYLDTDFYVSFPGFWYPNVADNDDVQFAFSRDGIKWQRPFRQPIIRLGMPGSGCEGYIDLAEGMIRHGNELWLYYMGLPEHHLAMEVKWDSVFARAIYRLDGFISEDGEYDGGELVTRPMIFAGSTLELNLDTSAGGWAYVELQDETGGPIRGYSLKEADRLNGNTVNMKASWGDKVDVGALAGKAVKIRFVLRNCKLYAFQFI